MGKQDQIITPKENLNANTVADTRAVAAKRGAVNAERQAMQTERALQRKYRRAVRHDDFGGAAQISQLLARTGGSTVGPVIRQAEEERAVAGQRAIDRADQQNKIRAGGAAVLMPGDQRRLEGDPVEGDPVNPPPEVKEGDQEAADAVADQATANPKAEPGAGKGTALKGSQRAAKGGGDRALGDPRDVVQVEAGPVMRPASIQSAPKTGGKALGPAPLTPEQQESTELFAYDSANAIESKASPFAGTTGNFLSSNKAIESAGANPVAVKEDDKFDRAIKQALAARDAVKMINDFEASYKPSAPSRYEPSVVDAPANASAKDPAPLNGPSPLSDSERNQLQNRKNYEESRKELALDPIEPSPVFSGGMSMTSPEARNAKIKEQASQRIKQEATDTAERNRLKEELINKRISEINLPDWQKTSIFGSVIQRFKAYSIRASGVDAKMSAEITEAIASRKSVLDAQKQNSDFSKAVSNLLPTQ